jgi:hypothetical protein
MTAYCITHGEPHEGIDNGLPCLIEDWDIIPGQAQVTETGPPSPVRTLRTGDLAYLHTLSGMVPVRVESLNEEEWSEEGWLYAWAQVRVTASRPGFHVGEGITMALPAPALVPRTKGRHAVSARFTTDDGTVI